MPDYLNPADLTSGGPPAPGGKYLNPADLVGGKLGSGSIIGDVMHDMAHELDNIIHDQVSGVMAKAQTPEKQEQILANPPPAAGINVSGVKSAGRTFGSAVAPAAYTVAGLLGAPLLRGAAAEAQSQGIDVTPDQASDALFKATDDAAKQARAYYDAKANEHLHVGGQIAGGLAAGGAMAAVPAVGIALGGAGAMDKAKDMLEKGYSLADVEKTFGASFMAEQAALLTPFAAGGRAAMALGATGTTAKVASAGIGAVLNPVVSAEQRAVENLASPDEYRQDVLPKDAAQLATEVGSGVAFGYHGAPNAPAARRATPADQLKQAAALLRGEKPEPAPQTVNYDIPPGERGVARLPPSTRGIDVQAADGINVPHPNDRAPSMDLSPDHFVDDRPEAPPPAAGIEAGPAGNADVEEVKAAPAPASDRQVELQRLRGLAEDPAVQKDLDTRIKAEGKKAQDAFEAEQKAKADAKTAAEMRALAEKTDDPVIAKALKAKADKLSPEPAPDLLAGQPDQPPAGQAERRATPRPTTGDNPMKPGEEPSGTRDKLHPGAVVSPHDPVFGSDENGKFLSELPPEKQAERRNATRLALEKAAREKAAAPAEAPPEPSPPTSPAGAAPAEERQHTVGSRDRKSVV